MKFILGLTPPFFATSKMRSLSITQLACWLVSYLLPTLSFAAPCQLYLSNQTLDYGTTTRAALLATGLREGNNVSLGKQAVSINVTCKQAAQITLFLRGMDNGTGHLRFADQGNITLSIRNGQLDGAPVNLGKIVGGVFQSDKIAPSHTWRIDQGIVPILNNQLAKGSHFSMDISVEPSVPAEATKVREDVNWEGSAQFDIETH